MKRKFSKSGADRYTTWRHRTRRIVRECLVRRPTGDEVDAGSKPPPAPKKKRKIKYTLLPRMLVVTDKSIAIFPCCAQQVHTAEGALTGSKTPNLVDVYLSIYLVYSGSIDSRKRANWIWTETSLVSRCTAAGDNIALPLEDSAPRPQGHTHAISLAPNPLPPSHPSLKVMTSGLLIKNNHVRRRRNPSMSTMIAVQISRRTFTQ